MKRGIFLLLLIILTTINVNAQNFSTYDEVLLNLNISSSISIIPKDSDYDIKSINVNLFIFPEDNWQQNVLKLETSPQAEQSSGNILFKWSDISTTKLNFQVNTDVKVKNKVFPIRNKILFPIQNLPEELKQWTKPTEKVNSDDGRIIRLASDIVEGEDDLFKVVFKIANFTKNHINYDLKFAGEVKSALWILNNKNGVCGDFSSLFMALIRALNIPIKYVVGVAYTNFENANEFVPHAWTEVYFPDVGWIPFDPTYGEYGYIDTSHVKLKEYIDVDNPSVHYEWSGKNFDVNIEKLQFNGKVMQETGTYNKPYSIETNIEADKIDIGSYQLIKTKFKNSKDYYIADQVYLFVPPELKILNNPNKALLLEPNQEKTLFWLLQVDPELSQGYTYTFPVTIKTLRDINYNSQFKAIPGGETYTLQELQNKLEYVLEEKEKTYSTNVDLDCSSQQTEIYTYEKLNVNCLISNIGNIYLENLYICIDKDCILLDLGIGQKKEIQFNTQLNNSKSNIEIIAKNELITKIEKISINIFEPPQISIQDLEYPKEIDFNEDYTLKFKAIKDTVSEIKEAKVYFNYNIYPIEDFDFQKEILINNLKGYDLIENENELQIIIEYKDKNGKIYTSSEIINIKLNQLNVWQKIISRINYVLNRFTHKIQQII